VSDVKHVSGQKERYDFPTIKSIYTICANNFSSQHTHQGPCASVFHTNLNSDCFIKSIPIL